MVSDLTKLIREADAALEGITAGPWEALNNGVLPNGAWLGPDVFATEALDGNGEPGGTTVGFSFDNAADAQFIAAAPDLMRRLRDALEGSEARRRTVQNAADQLVQIYNETVTERDEARTALSEERAYSAHLKDEVTRAKEWTGVSQWLELAEANATIERVEATCDDLDRMNQDTPGMPHANYNREIRRNVVARIRRAIEGAQ